MDIFADLVKANQGLQGRVQGLAYGIVSVTDDPLGLGRIQCLDASKGGRSNTNWLYRSLPFSSFSPPLPLAGETVLMGFIDGDPHQGVYFGSMQNLRNPVINSGDDLVIKVGSVIVTVKPEGNMEITGVTGLTMAAESVEFTQATSVTINGSQVCTVGAMDSRNDTLVTKGWV